MIALCLIVGQSAAMAARNDVTVYLENEEETEVNNEDPKGPRMPSHPVVCTIDFSNHRMELSVLPQIISYEVWDEKGESLIKSYASDSDMVAYLATVSGSFR